jgi:hypothetical protein
MKHLMSMGICAASAALADEPDNWTSEAPPDAVDVPVYIGRTAQGTRVYADGTIASSSQYRAAIHTSVEFSTGKINHNGQLTYAWRGEPAGTRNDGGESTWEYDGDCYFRRLLGPLQGRQAVGGTVPAIALTYVCTGVKTGAAAAASTSAADVHVPKRTKARLPRSLPRSNTTRRRADRTVRRASSPCVPAWARMAP